MSFINNVQNALNTRLSGVSGLPSVAWPNTKFVPSNSTSYVRPTLLMANGSLQTLSGQTVNEGIYQIDIYAPPEKGTSVLWLLADGIRDHFKSSLTLTSGSDTIYIQEISISQAQRVESWWSCYVQVNYICFN